MPGRNRPDAMPPLAGGKPQRNPSGQPKLILHIGTMKTGSTTIQNRMAHSRTDLARQGFLYPNTYSDTTHVRLAMAFSSYPKHGDFRNVLFEGADPKRYLEQVRTDFAAEMQAIPSGIHTVILSAELFSQYVRRQEDIQALHDFLAPCFSAMRVVVYLRRQDGHFASFYSEMLRNGFLHSPSMERLQEDKHIYDYWALLSAWAGAFGEEAIVPRLFERDTNKQYDAVADFLSVIGLATLPPEEQGKPNRNPSVNLYGQRILRDVGKMMKQVEGQGFARSLMWKKVNGLVTAALPGEGWRPTRAEARAFVARFEDANEQVRARYFPERDTLFSPDFAHFPEQQPDLSLETLAEAQTKVLFGVMKELVARDWALTKKKVARAGEEGTKLKGLMRVLRANPADHATRLELVSRQIKDGALDAAQFHINEVLRRDPDNARAKTLRTRIERFQADPASQSLEDAEA